MTGQPMRCCGMCSGFFLAYVSKEVYFCPKCKPKVWDGFDPQPYRVIQEQGGRGYDRQSCRDYATGRELCVIDRDGDMVTVRGKGRPDETPWQVHVANLKPMACSPN